MRYQVKIFILIFLLSGCGKPLWIKEVKPSASGILLSDNGFNTNADSININGIKRAYHFNLHGSAIKPTFYSNYILIPTLAGRIYGFNLINGKSGGMLKYKGEISSPITRFGQRIIFAVNAFNSATCSIFLYDPKNKEVVNSVKIPGSVKASLILFNKNVFIVNNYGTLYAINLIGEVDWKFNFKHKINVDFLKSGNRFLIFTEDGYLIKFNPAKRKIEFTKKITNGFSNNPAADGNLITIATKGNELLGIDFRGLLKWKVKENAPVKAKIVFNKNKIFVSLINGSIELREKESGRLIWRKNYGGIFKSPPLFFRNALILINSDGRLLFVSRVDGKILKTIKFKHRLTGNITGHRNIIFFGTETGEYYGYKFK